MRGTRLIQVVTARLLCSDFRFCGEISEDNGLFFMRSVCLPTSVLLCPIVGNDLAGLRGMCGWRRLGLSCGVERGSKRCLGPSRRVASALKRVARQEEGRRPNLKRISMILRYLAMWVRSVIRNTAAAKSPRWWHSAHAMFQLIDWSAGIGRRTRPRCFRD